jgi:NosR/NirI family transcriptional regulator, nitrous oxide reductase regulator
MTTMTHQARLAASIVAAALIATLSATVAAAADRFPRPDFQNGYTHPIVTPPPPRALIAEYLDVAVLAGALALAAYLALRRRSRRGILVLSVFSLVYFGFWRQGCVCPVGSLQNVALALVDPTYAIPITVLLFFLLPLVAALLFGRVFCAAVCPLGAAQDLVIVRPVKLPSWLNAALGSVPYLYLGLAIVFVAAGAGFVVCRYDPFVGFFRLGASFPMLVFGIGMLVLGTFVARPYCRFLCPYGVLLGWLSPLAWRQVSITPDTCINCRLCEDACPFDCIRKPTPPKAPETRATGVRRLAILLATLPLTLALGGWSGARIQGLLARLHPTVATARQVVAEDAGISRATTLESDTFRASGEPAVELLGHARAIRRRFRAGGWWLGGFMGLVFQGKLIALAVRRRRIYYEIDHAACVSCARCFIYCPHERLRLASSAGGADTP